MYTQDDNMWFQWVGMFGMLLLTGEFVVDFIIRMGKDDCFYSLSFPVYQYEWHECVCMATAGVAVVVVMPL